MVARPGAFEYASRDLRRSRCVHTAEAPFQAVRACLPSGSRSHSAARFRSHDAAVLAVLFVLQRQSPTFELFHKLIGTQPLRRISLPSPAYQTSKVLPQIGLHHVQGRPQPVVSSFVRDHLSGYAIKRPLPHGNVPHDQPCRINVDLLVVVGVVLKDFGGHITHTPCLACHPVCPLDLDQVRNLAQPEVPDLDMPILIQQEIRGFEVSVYDDGRAVVEETQCPGKLHTPPKHHFRWRHPRPSTIALSLPEEEVLEIPSRHILVQDHQGLADGACSQKHDQIGVPQTGQHGDLIDEICPRHLLVDRRGGPVGIRLQHLGNDIQPPPLSPHDDAPVPLTNL
mmetsp:Transcript_59997/g.147539  ORF Transcript_59997/g.147539 Transcript_59997/m.147539 type:complete len:339 (-) Transcript_59997:379-1395(-)